MSQTSSECNTYLFPDLDLIDPFEIILDRIFNGDNFDLISVYLLETREFYIVPFSTAIEVILYSFFVPAELMQALRLPILTIYSIPSIGLFLYFTIKNRDGKSLGFFLLLVILSISNVFLTINQVVSAILLVTAQGNLIIGIFGGYDYFLTRKEKKKPPTWIEQVVNET